jgi:hypothetical protein
MRLENRDVGIAHMVGHINIRPAGFQVGKALYGDSDIAYCKDAFSPDSSDLVRGIAACGEKGDQDNH